MGCNGDCYQGRWCNCKNKVSPDSEMQYACVIATIAGIILVIIGAVVL